MAAKRYNKGKTRFGLIPHKPLEHLAEVYTKGAHKYSVYEDDKGNRIKGVDIPSAEAYKYKLVESGSDNWREGQSWTESMESVERHIQAWKNGEDVDPEIKTLHLANAAWGMFSLMEYYKTHPELDDRKIKALNPRKIGLDIDGVLADFNKHLFTWFKLDYKESTHWNDPLVKTLFENVKKETPFWSSIPILNPPTDLHFEPHCYITARSIANEVTQAWLDKNGYPKAPLYSIGTNESKIDVAKESGIEIFVDDRYENFVELTNAGIFTYLFDAPYNRHYQVGHRRIKSLNEI